MIGLINNKLRLDMDVATLLLDEEGNVDLEQVAATPPQLVIPDHARLSLAVRNHADFDEKHPQLLGPGHFPGIEPDQFMSLVETYIENYLVLGYCSRGEWAEHYWGTPRNAMGTKIRKLRRGESIEVIFTTTNAPPMAALQNLAEYSGLTIALDYWASGHWKKTRCAIKPSKRVYRR